MVYSSHISTPTNVPTGRINPAREAAGGGFDEEDEEEDDAAPVTGGADLVETAVKVSELVARAWERSKRQRALESHVKGACCVFGCGWGK